MPRKGLRDLLPADYERSRVPEEATRHPLTVIAVFAGLVFAAMTIVTAGRLAVQLPFWELVGVFLLGCAVLCVFSIAMGLIGQRERLTFAILTRYTYGQWGTYIPSLLIPLMNIAIVGTVTTIVVGTFQSMVRIQGGMWFYLLVAIIVGVFMSTAIYGFKGLSYLSWVAFPMVVGLLIFFVILAATTKGGEITSMVSVPKIGFATATTIVIGTWITGAPNYSPDLMRFNRTARDVFITGVASWIVLLGFVLMSGALAAITTGQGDLVKIFSSLGLAPVGFIVFFIAGWTSIDNLMYSAALNIANVVRMEKYKIILIYAAISILAAWFGIYKYLLSYLFLIGALIPAIGGTMIADYWIVKRGSLEVPPETVIRPDQGGQIKKVVWPAIISTGLGMAVALSVPYGIPAINSGLLAFAAHTILGAASRQSCSVSVASRPPA